MALVDERGRVGGIVNLLDVLRAVVAIGLVALAFLAYLLFREPAPRLVAVWPTSLYQASNVHVTISGENLRPYMRVTFNDIRSFSFEIVDSTTAMVEMANVDAGTYDVVLRNADREVGRLSRAVTILPLPPKAVFELIVRGAFKTLAPARAREIKRGEHFPSTGSPTATVMSVGLPSATVTQIRTGDSMVMVPISGHVDVPAVLHVSCFAVSNNDGSLRCAVAGPVQQADVAPGSTILLPVAGDWLEFSISDVAAPNVH